jgi:hypothetical protein
MWLRRPTFTAQARFGGARNTSGWRLAVATPFDRQPSSPFATRSADKSGNVSGHPPAKTEPDRGWTRV